MPAVPNIRPAASHDLEQVRNVHQRAFPESESDQVVKLAADLMSEATTPETFTLVAEVDGEVVGAISFSPVTIESNQLWQGYILAPLGVVPDQQKGGVGSKLIESGMERLSAEGTDMLFVYGDPKFYGKFGFSAEAAVHYLPPYELQYPFGWQAVALRDARTHDEPVRISCVGPLCDPNLW